MKKTDDYQAKIDFWAARKQVPPLPFGVRIPDLTVKRFDSYAEFNNWKKEQILKLAELPVEQWRIPL